MDGRKRDSMMDGLVDLFKFFKDVKDEYTPESKALVAHKVAQELMPNDIWWRQRTELAKYISTTEDLTVEQIFDKIEYFYREDDRKYEKWQQH